MAKTTPALATRRDVLIAFTIITTVTLILVTILSLFDKSIGNLIGAFALTGGAWFGARVEAIYTQTNGNNRHMQETLAQIATSNIDNGGKQT